MGQEERLGLPGERWQQFAGETSAEIRSVDKHGEPCGQEVPVRVMGYRSNCDASGNNWQRQAFEEDSTTMLLLPRGAVIPLKATVAWGQNLMVMNLRSNRYAHCRVSNLRTTSGQSYVEIQFTHSIPDFWGNPLARDAASAMSELAEIAARLATEPVAAAPVANASPIPVRALAAAAGISAAEGGAPAPNCASEDSATVIMECPSPARERNGPKAGPEFFAPRPMECISVGEPVGESIVEAVETPTAEYVDTAPVPAGTNWKPVAAPAPRKRPVRLAVAGAAAIAAVLAGYYLYAPAEAALPAAIPAAMNLGSQSAANLSNRALVGAAISDGTQPEGNAVVSAPVPEVELENPAHQRVALVSNMILPARDTAIRPQAAPEMPMATGAAPAITATRTEAVLGPMTSAPPPPPEPEAAKPEPAADELTPAHLVSSVQPIYPPTVAQEKIAGDVVLQVTISAAGNVTEVKALSGPLALRGAAIAAVQQWKYEPARLRGQPAESSGVVTLKFRLR